MRKLKKEMMYKKLLMRTEKAKNKTRTKVDNEEGGFIIYITMS